MALRTRIGEKFGCHQETGRKERKLVPSSRERYVGTCRGQCRTDIDTTKNFLRRESTSYSVLEDGFCGMDDGVEHRFPGWNGLHDVRKAMLQTKQTKSH